MTHSFGDWIDDSAPDHLFAGVVVGLVTNIQDPEGLARVKVSFPWMPTNEESTWARIATLMAGSEHGTLFVPEVGDEVLVAFEHGRAEFPYVIGSLWNGESKPPEAVEEANDIRVIRSRSGHVVRFVDEEYGEKIEIIDSSGENKIVIDTAESSITIAAKDPLTIEAGGDLAITAEGKVEITGTEVNISAEADVALEAGGELNATASGPATIKGAVVNIN